MSSARPVSPPFSCVLVLVRFLPCRCHFFFVLNCFQWQVGLCISGFSRFIFRFGSDLKCQPKVAVGDWLWLMPRARGAVAVGGTQVGGPRS